MAPSTTGRQTKISAFFAKRSTSAVSTATIGKIETIGAKKSRAVLPTKSGISDRQSPPQGLDRDSSSSSSSSSTETALVCPAEPNLDLAMASSATPTELTLGQRIRPCSQFTILPITPGSMISFQRLLQTLLPVGYPPRFFSDILSSNSALGRVAVWHDGGIVLDTAKVGPDSTLEAIAGVKGRLEDVDTPDPQDPDLVEQHLYIQTLGVLAPFRGCGVAAQLLDAVIDEALASASASSAANGVQTKVTSVYAHVWQENEDALGWYRRRGFEVETLLDGYYRKLRPAGAYVVRKRLDHVDT